MLTGIKVQIAAESWIVIGRLCCYLHFYPGQNDKCPEVLRRTSLTFPIPVLPAAVMDVL